MKIDNENIRYIYCYYKHNKEIYECVPSIYNPKSFNRAIDRFKKDLNKLKETDGQNLLNAYKKYEERQKRSHKAILKASKISELTEVDMNQISRVLNIGLKTRSRRYFTDINAKKNNVKCYCYNLETNKVKEFDSVLVLMEMLNKEFNINSLYHSIYKAVKINSKFRDKYFFSFTNDFSFINEKYRKYHLKDFKTNEVYNNLSSNEVISKIREVYSDARKEVIYASLSKNTLIKGRFLANKNANFDLRNRNIN